LSTAAATWSPEWSKKKEEEIPWEDLKALERLENVSYNSKSDRIKKFSHVLICS